MHEQRIPVAHTSPPLVEGSTSRAARDGAALWREHGHRSPMVGEMTCAMCITPCTMPLVPRTTLTTETPPARESFTWRTSFGEMDVTRKFEDEKLAVTHRKTAVPISRASLERDTDYSAV